MSIISKSSYAVEEIDYGFHIEEAAVLIGIEPGDLVVVDDKNYHLDATGTPTVAFYEGDAPMRSRSGRPIPASMRKARVTMIYFLAGGEVQLKKKDVLYTQIRAVDEFVHVGEEPLALWTGSL